MMRTERVARSRPTLEDFEPRILYSADSPAAIAAALLAEPAATQSRVVDTTPAATAGGTELVFIDSRVANGAQMQADIAAQAAAGRPIESFLLDANQDGLAQMTAVIAAHGDIGAVHLISHGSVGEITLGNTTLDSNSLLQYAGDIASWRSHLSSDADLLIYGCDVGAGTDGSALLNGLAQLSGASVAASNDDTGNTALGGNWNLEVQTGTIDVASALDASGQAQWMGLLANDTAPILGTAGSGTVQTAVSASGSSSAYASAVQGDGKLLVAGAAYVGSTLEFSLVRYNADGSLDTTFGGGTGKVLKAVGTGNAQANSLSIQADGKIILGGSASNGSNTDFALVRFNGDGSLDTGFGSGGTVLTDFGAGDDSIAKVLVQGDGRIVAAGTVTIVGNINFGAARYNTDGTLDTSYGGGGTSTGKVNTDVVTNSQDYAAGAVLQSDGSLVIAGWSNNFGQNDFSVIRYTTAGQLDTSFGTGGRSFIDFGGNSFDIARSIAVQSDDRLVIAGDTFNNGYQFAVARLTASGVLDTSFNGTGKVTTDVGTADEHGYAVAVQGDGKIVVVGQSNNTAPSFATVRYLANGALDTSFNGTGIVTTKFTSTYVDEVATTVTVTPGGTIYTAGNGTPTAGGNAVLMIASYNANGSPNVIYGGTSSLATTIAFTENGSAVVMAPNAIGYDNELAMQGNYAGATLTLVRHGGASAQDVFSATGSLSALTQGASLVYAGTTIGSVTTNSAGTLVLTFNVNATQALVNSVLQSLAYSNNSDAPPASLQIDWSFNDGNTTNAQGSGGAMSGSGTTSVNVTQINDAPTFTNNTSATLTQITEDQINNSGQTVASFVTNISDPDGAAVPQGIAITAASTSIGTWQYSIDGGTSWQAVGTPSATSALLLRSTDLLRVNPDGKNGGSGSLTYRAWDQTSGTAGTSVNTSSTGGATAFSTATNNATITITAVNDAPSLSGSSVPFPTINEDAASSAAQLVSAIVGTITDVDTGALKGIAIVAANPGNGTWQIQTNGTSWVNLDSVNISGTAAMLLDANDKIRFVPDGKNATAATLTYRAWDQTSGTHGTLADTSTFGGNSAFSATTLNVGITVTAVNDAPSMTPIHPTLTGINEDANPNPGQSIASFIGGSISDVDASAITGIAITSATTTGTGKWQYSTNGGTSWSDLGSVQTTAARLLLASDWVRYLPDTRNGGSVTLGYVAWDTTSGTRGSTASTTASGGITAFSNTADTATLTVVSLNDAPTLSGANAMAPIAENPSSNPGTSVQSLVSGKLADVDTGAVAGIAVTAVDNSNGSWQYTLDGGTNWQAFPAVSANAAWLLAADANTLIRFVPATNYSGTVANGLTFRAWDRTSGSADSAADTTTNGGTSAFSLATASTSITVSATPTPIGTSSTLTNNEDTVVTLKVGDFGFGSPNGLSLKAVIVDPSTAGTLALNGAAVTAGQSITVADINAGLLTFTPDPNANGSPYASFTFQVQDSADILDPTPKTLTFNVLPVNDAPQLAPFGPSLPSLTEKDTSDAGHSVASIVGSSITDPDGSVPTGIAITAANNGNGSWEYSLDGGTNWHAINAVAPTSALLLRASDLLRFVPDGKNGTTASLTYAAWDQTSGTPGSAADSTVNGGSTAFSIDTDQVGITVTSVNDPPAITSNGGGATAAISLPENQSAVTTVTATDPDLPADTLSFSIAPVNDGALFSINASGELSFNTPPDYDAPQNANNTYLVTVQVADGQGGVTTQALTITVTPVNDNAPILAVAPGAAFTEDGPPVRLAPAATVSDVELNAIGNYAGATLALQRHGGASADDVFSAGGSIASLAEGGALIVSGTTIGSVVTNSAGSLMLSFNTNATQALVNSALQGIAYANSNHNPPGSVALDWTFDDGNTGAQGSGPALSGSAGTLVTITAVNDAPVLAFAAPSLPRINEDALSNSGISVASLLGSSVTDADIPSLSGIAIDGQSIGSGTGTWQFSIDGGSSWSDFGTVGVSTSLLLRASDQVRFMPDGANGTTASFSYRAWDQTGVGVFGTAADTSTHGGSSAFSDGRNTASIDVASVNDAPQGRSTTLTTAEDTAYVFTMADFGFSDPVDSPANGFANLLIGSLPASGGLSLNGVAVTAGKSIGTSDIAAGLLRFTPAANANGNGYASFTFHVQDDGGTANGGSDTDPTAKTITIDVSAVHDAPLLAPGAPVLATITEDQTTNAGQTVASIIGSTITLDDDGSQAGIAITSSVAGNGMWQYSLDGGSTWSAVGTTSNGAALLLRATDRLRFVPDGRNGTSASIGYRAWDQSSGTAGTRADATLNGGTSAFSVASDSASLTVLPVNDAPSGSSRSVTTLEDTPYTFAIADFGFSDSTDEPANTLLGVTLTSLPASGALSLNGVALTAGQSISAAAIAAGQLSWAPAANMNGSASFMFQVQDDGGTANGGVDLDPTPKTLTLVVTPVNDAPLLAPVAPVLAPITEDQTGNAGQSVASLIGHSISDGDSAALQGIAIDAAANGNGAWQFSIDGGASWQAVGPVSDGAALLLRASDLIRFQPDGFNGTQAAFGYRAWDQTSGTAGGRADAQVNGGSSAFSNATDSASLSVLPVNDAPSGAAHGVSLAADASYSFSIADFGFSDPIDSPPNGLLAVQLTSLPGLGQLLLNGAAVSAGQRIGAADIAAGGLVFVPGGNGQDAATTSFTFQVQDDGGIANGGHDLDPTARTMTLVVSAVTPPVPPVPPAPPAGNTPPTIVSNGGGGRATIVLDSSGSAHVGVTTVDATDPDLPQQTLTYFIAGGAQAAHFNIDATTGVLTLVDLGGLTGLGNQALQVVVGVSDGESHRLQALTVIMRHGDVLPIQEPAPLTASVRPESPGTPATRAPVLDPVTTTASGAAAASVAVTAARVAAAPQGFSSTQGALDGPSYTVRLSWQLAALHLRAPSLDLVALHAPDDRPSAPERERLLLLDYQLQSHARGAGHAGETAAPEFIAPAELATTDLRALITPGLIGGLALSAGALAWAGRGGALLASLLVSAPAWRNYDLLPVLRQSRRHADEDDEPPSDDASPQPPAEARDTQPAQYLDAVGQ